jgi:hypothetical protein
MTLESSWKNIVSCKIDIQWTVTNPPFNKAIEILQYAFKYSTHGVAFFMRLSFLEPTKDRTPFLLAHPPTQIIVMPRVSFTGDGKTDSVTCAWFIWEKTGKYRPIFPITIYPRERLNEVCPA